MLLYRRSRAFHCPPRLKKIFAGLLLMGIVQPVLGIATLLTQVDIILATAHQAGAMALLALLVWLLHEIPAVQQEK
jgi:cytochrome c oxidase assembly protein subunit 15